VYWNKYFIPLFRYFNKEKNKIEGIWWYEMEFRYFFFKFQQWNIILFHFAPLHSVIFYQSKQSLIGFYDFIVMFLFFFDKYCYVSLLVYYSYCFKISVLKLIYLHKLKNIQTAPICTIPSKVLNFPWQLVLVNL
jgi:hypothetical protein